MNIHCGYLAGCIGRIVGMHARYYAAHAGFGVEFEAKVARDLADFATRGERDGDGLWLAVHDGEIHGSIAIDGSRADFEGAHLRGFIMSDRYRNQGIGSQLLKAAVDFCRSKSYAQIFLWTFDQLPAARHLYLKHGFELELERQGLTWGKRVNEQKYVLRVMA